MAHKIILRHAIYDSEKIIAPSEFTKNDILKNFKVDAKKIVVTLLGVHSSQFTVHSSPTNDCRRDSSTSLGMTHGINKPYILYVGVAYPHKNLDGLIEAWKIFRAEHGNDYQLVLAGRKNYFYERLEQTHPSVPSQEGKASVIFTGYIPDEELPGLYKNASLYVFPSFYEGFGLPPLEAMTYGVPVASSNATCMPEILGQAAAYFDPRNPRDMADTIWHCLNDSDLRFSLNKNSTQLIHNYSWENTARATLDVYINVV